MVGSSKALLGIFSSFLRASVYLFATTVIRDVYRTLASVQAILLDKFTSEQSSNSHQIT